MQQVYFSPANAVRCAGLFTDGWMAMPLTNKEARDPAAAAKRYGFEYIEHPDSKLNSNSNSNSNLI